MSDIQPVEITSYTRMTGDIYDLIYANKQYESETAKLAGIIRDRCKSGGNSMLETACGTGKYMQYLAADFEVEGFDLSTEQVAAAKKRLPEANIFVADMLDFDTGKQYDAVLCLFSSIGYLITQENLKVAIKNMAKHTKPGGLVIVEPWIKAVDLKRGRFSLEAESTGDFAVARMGTVSFDGIVTTLDMHHMVGAADGVEHFLERHKLAMYSDEDFQEAFTEAGLTVEIDPIGLTNRRLCVGQKTLVA